MGSWRLRRSCGCRRYGGNVNQINTPWDIYVDADLNVTVADYPNHRIIRWAPGATEGVVVAGGNGSGADNSNTNPRGIYVDEDNDFMYIADSNNHRIVKWKLLSEGNCCRRQQWGVI